jgi:predicted ATP pyrophosphatase (TIGR00289 family)
MVNQEDYMMNIVQEGFKVMIVGVAAEGLDKSWLGRIITTDTIKELKNLNNRFGINIAFEGGEAETFTLDCPLFNQRIEVQKIKTHWFNYYGFLEIKNARLIDKTFNAQKS